MVRGRLGSDSSLLVGFLVSDGRGFLVATTGWHTLVLFPWISLFLFFERFSSPSLLENGLRIQSCGFVSAGFHCLGFEQELRWLNLSCTDNVRQIANGTYMYPIVYRRIQGALFFHISVPVCLFLIIHTFPKCKESQSHSCQNIPQLVWYIPFTKNAKSPFPLLPSPFTHISS